MRTRDQTTADRRPRWTQSSGTHPPMRFRSLWHRMCGHGAVSIRLLQRTHLMIYPIHLRQVSFLPIEMQDCSRYARVQFAPPIPPSVVPSNQSAFTLCRDTCGYVTNLKRHHGTLRLHEEPAPAFHGGHHELCSPIQALWAQTSTPPTLAYNCTIPYLREAHAHFRPRDNIVYCDVLL